MWSPKKIYLLNILYILFVPISGLSDAKFGQFTFMVALFSDVKFDVKYSGVLITDKHILTSAQSFLRLKPGHYGQAAAGDFTVETDEGRTSESRQIRHISKVIFHPEVLISYAELKSTHAQNDVAIAIVDERFKLNRYVSTIQMANNSIPEYSVTINLGFGVAASQGKDDYTLTWGYFIMQRLNCGIYASLYYTMYCTHHERDLPLKGDIGSPILYGTNWNILYGIMYMSEAEGDKQAHSIFVNILDNKDWILEQIMKH